MQPLVSIIIPAYNEELYITKSLDSIKNQNYPNIETIVVCNGCTDSTEKIAKLYNTKVISLKEKNLPTARNTGAKHAKGEFLVFLDADTRIIDPYTIKVISNTLQKKNVIGTCKFLTNKDTFKFKLFKFFKTFFSYFGMVNGILFYRKDLFIKVGGYKNVVPVENHSLIKSAKKYAKFIIINKKVLTSMRRYERMGFIHMSLYWLKLLLKKKKDYYSL